MFLALFPLVNLLFQMRFEELSVAVRFYLAEHTVENGCEIDLQEGSKEAIRGWLCKKNFNMEKRKDR